MVRRLSSAKWYCPPRGGRWLGRWGEEVILGQERTRQRSGWLVDWLDLRTSGRGPSSGPTLESVADPGKDQKMRSAHVLDKRRPRTEHSHRGPRPPGEKQSDMRLLLSLRTIIIAVVCCVRKKKKLPTIPTSPHSSLETATIGRNY